MIHLILRTIGPFSPAVGWVDQTVETYYGVEGVARGSTWVRGGGAAEFGGGR